MSNKEQAIAALRPVITAVRKGESYSRVCDGGGGRCSNKLAESDCIVVDGHVFTVAEYLAPLLDLGYVVDGMKIAKVEPPARCKWCGCILPNASNADYCKPKCQIAFNKAQASKG